MKTRVLSRFLLLGLLGLFVLAGALPAAAAGPKPRSHQHWHRHHQRNHHPQHQHRNNKL